MAGRNTYAVNAAGTYVIAGLPAGTYTVAASSSAYVTNVYDGADCTTCSFTAGTPVTVAAGADTSAGVDFALSRGGNQSPGPSRRLAAASRGPR